ncbi:MAG TPA: HupE/UreJ family protein [Phenylobacterium sp.]|nr:HupE/UreJ family protein [Phenylobacterium sp.]
MRRRLAVGAGIAALALAGPASAHVGTGLAGGFGAGFVHPLSGADHLLAMVSVGLWGAILGRPLVYVLPVAFPAMMVAGAILGMFGAPLPPVELGVALSALVLGGCVALAVRAPVWLATAMAAAFAVFHGYAHGRELPSAADPVGYSAGFVLATGLLHLAGVGIGAFSRWPAGLTATRALGGGVAVAGVWFLYRAAGA